MNTEKFTFIKCEHGTSFANSDVVHLYFVDPEDKDHRVCLKEYPDELQPGSGYQAFFADRFGRLEWVRIFKGDSGHSDHFNPPAQFISNNMDDIIGYFREESSEWKAIIEYGKQRMAEKKEG